MIEIDMGGEEPLLLSARLMDAVCPVSPVEELPVAEELTSEGDAGADPEDTDLDDEEIELISASDNPFMGEQ